jgi:hypothetical protein
VVAVVAAVVAGLTASASATGSPHPSAVREPAGLHIHLTGAALTTAADRCATWAANAGFANNGYMGGGLTIAVAVALAESGCNPAACYDNTKKAACTEQSETPGDKIDRGAWQIDNQLAAPLTQVSDACAYSGPCSAAASYTELSQDGTYFALWATYSSDYYATYLWAAQQAVNGLHSGAVPTAVTGSCLGFASDGKGAPARLANCSEKGSQVWRLVGATLRSAAGLCLAATSSRHAAIVKLQPCRRSTLQNWEPKADAELYNAGAHRCLVDPKWGQAGGDLPGIELMTAPCAVSQGDGWFEP